MGILDKIKARAGGDVSVTVDPLSTEPKASMAERLGLGSRKIPEGLLIKDGKPRMSGSNRYPPAEDPDRPSADLSRIRDLPRRLNPDLPSLIEDCHAEFRINPERCQVCPGIFKDRKCPTSLFEIQAWALAEASMVGGLLAPIGVGHGKTLIDLLLPMAIDCRTALLLIPGMGMAQFMRELEGYAQHWKIPTVVDSRWMYRGRPALHVLSFEEFSRPENTNRLALIEPDLIIADEAHCLKRRESARTKRFLRYVSERKEAKAPVKGAFLSGTITDKSIKDYAHLAEIALGPGSPLPHHWPTVERWATALDARKPGKVGAPPGGLAVFCRDWEEVRSGFQRRLVETAGVVATEEGSAANCSLLIHEREAPPFPPAVAAAINSTRLSSSRPDGEEFKERAQVAKCVGELASGFYYKWRWPKNTDKVRADVWLEARKNYNREVREKLHRSKEFMDSPALLYSAAKRYWEGGCPVCQRGTEAKHAANCTGAEERPLWPSEYWREWVEVAHWFDPPTEAVWIDDFLARDAAEWATKNVGIVWYEHTAFGKKVAEISGLPLYDGGTEPETASGKQSIVCSIDAHHKIKNMQQFSRNLIANVPSNGKIWEQMLGRTHRRGQAADEVEVYVYLHTDEIVEALESAQEQARYVFETTANRQKLLYATYSF